MKKTMILAVFSFLLVVACKGPQGEVGPQGVQGIQGEKGATGAAGTNGINGATGDSGIKVLYSDWSQYKNWPIGTLMRTRHVDFGPAGFWQVDPDKDILIVYMKTLFGEIQQLPCNGGIQYPDISWSFTIQPYNSTYGVNGGNLYASKTKDFVSNLELEGPKFRYVLIKITGKPNGRNAIHYPNYETVKKAYNIPD